MGYQSVNLMEAIEKFNIPIDYSLLTDPLLFFANVCVL